MSSQSVNNNVEQTVPQKKASKTSEKEITQGASKGVTLVEDSFGFILDKAGKQQSIKRFTWKNQNNIQAQVITYGARVISLKLPNRKLVVEDVVLGFDDIEGYLYHNQLYMGATIGRVTDKVENATFVIDQKQYWLNNNDNSHHCNGGFEGLDKVVWIPSVNGNKVTLSYVSRDLDEGYPGDLFIRVVFELTAVNEFIIDMDAVTTKSTIVNLTNLMYFNLAGHGAGPDELYKHVVTINANCFLPFTDNGLPSGEIQNVIYTKNDYQIPKILKNEIGINPDDAYDGHLCINRGIDQGHCFMARALHPPSGRILELYSNQCGLHFNTGNHFGQGVTNISVSSGSKQQNDTCSICEFINKLHAYVAETASIDSKVDYKELNCLIGELHQRKFGHEADATIGDGEEAKSVTIKDGEEAKSVTIKDAEEVKSVTIKDGEEQSSIHHPEIESLMLNPLQAKYLTGMLEATKRDAEYSNLAIIIQEILDTATIKDQLEMKSDELIEITPEKEEKEKAPVGNIPSFYKDGRIHGKNNAIYKKHGGICFQSENYPNAIYHKEFPNCILRPGETYRHTIVYKFWIQAGIPNKWIKRNFPTKSRH